jgi:chromosome segregation ATPase
MEALGQAEPVTPGVCSKTQLSPQGPLSPMSDYLGAQFASLQLEKGRLAASHANLTREVEALRQERQLEHSRREAVEEECAAARELVASLQARVAHLSDAESRCSGAEATVTTLLARLRTAEETSSSLRKQLAAMEERLSDELVQARTELATARFEIENAHLAQRKARVQLQTSKESEAALEQQLISEKLRSADLAERLETAQQLARRLQKEAAAQQAAVERHHLAPLNSNAAH